MAGAETVYSTSAASPPVLRRASAQRTRFAVYRSGAIVEPESATYQLTAPGGVEVVSDAATVDADGSVYYALAAEDLPVTLAYGEGYTEAWTLTFAGDEGVRVFRRRVTLGRFELAPPLGQAELVGGSYPDLLVQIGPAFGGASGLQLVLDEAWATVLRFLWRAGTPGTVVVDSADAYDLYRELALSRIFAALYAADPIDRWRDLRDDHRAAYQDARSGLRVTVDRDQDGTEDSLSTRPVGGPVVVNAAPSRSWRGGRRW